MNVLRWILVPAVVVFGIYVGVGVAFFLFRGGLLSCPTDSIALTKCAAPWFSQAERVVNAIGAAVAAFLSPFLAALVAPTHKAMVAAVVAPLVLLCVVTIVVLLGAELSLPLGCAIAAAAVALFVVRRGRRSAT